MIAGLRARLAAAFAVPDSPHACAPSWRQAIVTASLAMAAVVVLLNADHAILGPTAWKDQLPSILLGSLVFDVLLARTLLGAWGSTLARVFILVLCLVTTISFLDAHWTRDLSDYYAIGGLVPYSDASGYLMGARRVLEFGRMDAWAGRRPLPIALYAGLLWVSGGNLRLAGLLLAVLIALALFVATIEVCDRWGAFPSVIFLLVVLSGVQVSVGRFMTEGWGFLLATLALPAVMRGFALRRPFLVAAGGFLWALAFVTRPGALLAPLFVALYAAWEYRGGGGLKSMLNVVWALGVLMAAGLLSSAACSLIVPLESASFGSIYYTLYGLATGGRGWAAVISDHPGLGGLPAGAMDKAVRRLALSAFVEHPGVVASYVAASSLYTLRNLFPAVCNLGSPVSYELLTLPFWLAIAMLFYRWRQAAHSRFLLPVLAGIVLSAAVTADGGFRALVATTPLVGLLCAYGASWAGAIFRVAKPRGALPFVRPQIALGGRTLLVLTSAVSLLCLTMPPLLAVRATIARAFDAHEDDIEAWRRTLASGERLMKVRLPAGAGVLVGEGEWPSPFRLGDTSVPVRAMTASNYFSENGVAAPTRGYVTSVVDVLADDTAEAIYLFFDEPPSHEDGYVLIAATALRKVRMTHSMYTARVLGRTP